MNMKRNGKEEQQDTCPKRFTTYASRYLGGNDGTG